MTTGASTKPRIYLSPPHIGQAEFSFVEEAFRTNWIAPMGPHVDAFEREFCARFGFRHAAALVSGTAAIHLAMRLLGVRSGDEVVCSTLTFAASANPIVYEQARPVFIDSDEASWNMDPALLEEWLAARARTGRLPKAVIAVDLYGQCADLERITAACERHGVPLIEDAAEALGATCAGPAWPAPLAGWRSFRLTGTRSSPPPAVACWCRRAQAIDRPGAVSRDPGARSRAALPAPANRLQLPPEQRAGWDRPRPTPGARRAGRGSSPHLCLLRRRPPGSPRGGVHARGGVWAKQSLALLSDDRSGGSWSGPRKSASGAG